MNREEAIKEACGIIALAYQSIGDFRYASDGFCSECERDLEPNWDYKNDGYALDYVRQAVVDKLKADGYTIPSNFDPNTGTVK